MDCKVRERDFATIGKDDLALETWSVIETKKIGWTRDHSKYTDYILWLWSDTKRWCLMPFPMLCKVFSDKWTEWSRQFQVAHQRTASPDRDWHSECIFVNRRDVWAAIYQHFGGNRLLNSVPKNS